MRAVSWAFWAVSWAVRDSRAGMREGESEERGEGREERREGRVRVGRVVGVCGEAEADQEEEVEGCRRLEAWKESG